MQCERLMTLIADLVLFHNSSKLICKEFETYFTSDLIYFHHSKKCRVLIAITLFSHLYLNSNLKCLRVVIRPKIFSSFINMQILSAVNPCKSRGKSEITYIHKYIISKIMRNMSHACQHFVTDSPIITEYSRINYMAQKWSLGQMSPSHTMTDHQLVASMWDNCSRLGTHSLNKWHLTVW